MDEQDQKPAQEPQAEKDAEVRAAMELARQALESSVAETERAKRLRREIDERGDLSVSSEPAEPDEKSGSN